MPPTVSGPSVLTVQGVIAHGPTLQDEGCGQHRERLGEGVDLIGEGTNLIRGELGVKRETVGDLLHVEQRLECVEFRVETIGQRGVACDEDVAYALVCDAGAINVGLEVPQIRVRPELLLARHLA